MNRGRKIAMIQYRNPYICKCFLNFAILVINLNAINNNSKPHKKEKKIQTICERKRPQIQHPFAKL